MAIPHGRRTNRRPSARGGRPRRSTSQPERPGTSTIAAGSRRVEDPELDGAVHPAQGGHLGSPDGEPAARRRRAGRCRSTGTTYSGSQARSASRHGFGGAEGQRVPHLTGPEQLRGRRAGRRARPRWVGRSGPDGTAPPWQRSRVRARAVPSVDQLVLQQALVGDGQPAGGDEPPGRVVASAGSLGPPSGAPRRSPSRRRTRRRCGRPARGRGNQARSRWSRQRLSKRVVTRTSSSPARTSHVGQRPRPFWRPDPAAAVDGRGPAEAPA